MSDPRPYRRWSQHPEDAEPSKSRTAGRGPALDESSYYEYTKLRSGKEQLEQALDLAYRNKWLILGAFLFIFAAVTAYTYTVAPEYEANSLILIDPEQRGNTLGDQFSFAPSDVFARNDRSLTNELIILRNSMSIARGVAEQLVEMKTVPGTDVRLSILETPEERVEPLTVEEVALRLRGDQFIRFAPEGRESDVIRVTSTSTAPGEAALLANLYTQEYINLTQDASRARLAAQREFLEKQQEQRVSELQEVEGRIETYMRQEGAVALDQEGRNLVEQIAQVEAQRDETRVELQMRQASLRSLEQELEDISPELARRIASGVEQEIAAVQEKIAELEVRKEQALLHNPDVAGSADIQQIDQQIRQLRDEVRRLSEQYVDEVLAVGGVSLKAGEGLTHVGELKRQIASERITITGLEAKIEVLGERLQEYNAELRTIPEQSMELAQLQRGRSYAERMYQFVVERLQETRIQEESELGYANVIAEALVPSMPVRPNTRRNLILGAFFGLLFGIGIAVARDKLDNSIYKPEDLREQGHNVLGVVPSMDTLIREEYFGETMTEQEGQRYETTLVTLLNPMSTIAEAYRHLRTNIQFSLPDTVVQTVLVTSPNMGEGKSVTAANLAIVMAQAGRRTLLVDCDLRRPQVHKKFGLQREPGLVQRLFSETEEAASVDVVETGIDDLYAIPAGKTVPNPSELLGSLRMREFVAQLRQEFDIIIFDTPPVLVATDPVLLSTQCDATLVVAKAGESKEPELDHCMDVLGGVGAKVIGLLLNEFDLSMAYGYKYKYKYKYYAQYGYRYQSYYEDGEHSSSRQRATLFKRT